MTEIEQRLEHLTIAKNIEDVKAEVVELDRLITQAEQVRGLVVFSQSTFQNAALSLALQEQNTAARQLAGAVMLHWKQLQGEEEAYLARLARRSPAPCRASR